MVSFRSSFFVALVALSTASWAHPLAETPRSRDLKISSTVHRRATNGTAAFDALFKGNEEFKKKNPALLQKLADDGQEPPFMFLGCSDSRVSEGTVFGADPGTLFTQRNIANQFLLSDTNTHSVLAYAVADLGVQHIIVMGHYGCGGVAASIMSAPTSNVDAANGLVQGWIEPIRQIIQTSTRPEIVTMRESIKGKTVVEEPDIKDPGFRALVEENVKAGVARIATTSVILNHYAALAAAEGTPASSTAADSSSSVAASSTSTSSSAAATETTAAAVTRTPILLNRRSGEAKPPADVFIHGFVYDIESGDVANLGVSVGPPGKAIPPVPFAAVAQAAESAGAAHGSTSTVTATEAAVTKASYRRSLKWWA